MNRATLLLCLPNQLFPEINRQRAAQIARRLFTSDEPTARLALSIGYGRPAHMTEFFDGRWG